MSDTTQRWQYPIVTKPQGFNAASFKEQITADKWFVQPEIPRNNFQQKVASVAAIACMTFFVKPLPFSPETFPERAQVDKWYAVPERPDSTWAQNKINALTLRSYPFHFWDPNKVFPERAQVDKWSPIKPDYLFREPPINVGDSVFSSAKIPAAPLVLGWGPELPDFRFAAPAVNVGPAVSWNPNINFPEAVSVDKYHGIYPDYLFRKQPNNVGDAYFFGELETAPAPEYGEGIYPDLLFRKPPVNVGGSHFLDPNVAFKESITADKFIGSYPDYLNRRQPNNVGDSFFLGELETAPAPEMGYAFYPDIVFRRPPNNVADIFWNPNAFFPERPQVDKFGPIAPAYIWTVPPKNVGEPYSKSMGTFLPEAVSIDRFNPSMPSYIYREPPNNVGDAAFWGNFTPPATTPRASVMAPDAINRLPPINVGPFLAWDPNIIFAERTQIDKWIGTYPAYLFRAPPINVGPSSVYGVLQSLFTIPAQFNPSYPDYIFRRPPINVGEPLSWDPNKSFPERVQLDKFIGSYPDYLWRVKPINVGDSTFWSTFTPKVYTPQNLVWMPDYLWPVPVKNVGGSHFMDPNVKFPQAVSVDRWMGWHPDYLNRVPPLNVGPALAWSDFTPAVVPPLDLAAFVDFIFRKPPPNVGPSLALPSKIIPPLASFVPINPADVIRRPRSWTWYPFINAWQRGIFPGTPLEIKFVLEIMRSLGLLLEVQRTSIIVPEVVRTATLKPSVVRNVQMLVTITRGVNPFLER